MKRPVATRAPAAQCRPSAPPPAAPAALRVLVVDDHVVVRRGIMQILASRFPQATFGEADQAAAAWESIAHESWDVVLLDITLPGRNGLDLLKDIHRERPHLPVLILSIHPEDQFALRALRAGASGYLTKDLVVEELVAAVNKVLAGGRYIRPSLAERLVAELQGGGTGLPHEELSDREFQVLRLLAAGRTVKELSLELSLSVKTISTYRTRVLQKLHLHSNTELTRYALAQKLIE